ncbi:MAG: hypothetical protein AB7S38_08970 [Vulcanimicrobiota bacterium]
MPEQHDFFELLELAAESFNYSDVDTASLELGKALTLISPRVNEAASPAPNATDPWSEAHKALDALAIKDFPLAALLFRKALAEQKATLPEQRAALESARRFATAIEGAMFTSAALHLRAIRDSLEKAGLRVTAGLV